MTHDTKTAEPPTPVRKFSVRLPATRKGAHRARTLATEQLRAWRLPFDTAAHIVAELAANAVLHGHVPGRDFRLDLAVTDATLRIEVTDTRAESLPTMPTPTPDTPSTAESGRGLLLITALATHWGVTSGPVPCKTVWAEIGLTGAE